MTRKLYIRVVYASACKKRSISMAAGAAAAVVVSYDTAIQNIDPIMLRCHASREELNFRCVKYTYGKTWFFVDEPNMNKGVEIRTYLSLHIAEAMGIRIPQAFYDVDAGWMLDVPFVVGWKEYPIAIRAASDGSVIIMIHCKRLDISDIVSIINQLIEGARRCISELLTVFAQSSLRPRSSLHRLSSENREAIARLVWAGDAPRR
jgi:hypothetical protein